MGADTPAGQVLRTQMDKPQKMIGMRLSLLPDVLMNNVEKQSKPAIEAKTFRLH
jgi:hypothetical protein